MEMQRFNALVDGDEPTLEDYAAIVAVAESLPYELLWELLRTSPKMHWLLRGVVSKNLQERIPKANVDSAIDSIATELASRKKDAASS